MSAGESATLLPAGRVFTRFPHAFTLEFGFYFFVSEFNICCFQGSLATGVCLSLFS